ncbi:MAG: N-acetylneuraminate synthase family protein [Phycisphaerales bacterium]|nr:N-acetylneuraminate synthase family protein [Phycisphaerales bacterium]
MHIRDRQIGPDHPPYVIAEIGVNHDGSVDRAVGLVEAADRAGADAVKLQLFRTDLLMSRAAKLAAYQKAAGETDPLAMLRRLELPAAHMLPVMERAHDLGLHAILTVFSVELVAEAERVRDAYGGWDAYKSASPDIINKPLLHAMAATGRPLIVSTGASSIDEVARAVGWLQNTRDRLALLQCVSSYPVPEGQDGLGGIRALRERFTSIPVGYSDHTDTIDTAWRAVACGASILEKHLTYDKHAPGPDHAASATDEELGEYTVEAVGRWAHPRGTVYSSSDGDTTPPANFTTPFTPPAEKRVLDCERDVRLVSRQSLTTTRDLPAGHTLTRADLTIKRPGTGIEPWRLDDILGRSLATPAEADMPLTDELLAPS